MSARMEIFMWRQPMWYKICISALYPRRCPVCDRIVTPKGALVCPRCRRKLSFVKQPVCKRCGKEVLADTMEYCRDCSRHKRSFDGGVALLNYNEAAKHSMAQIKYKNKREYLDFYSQEILVRYGKRLQTLKLDALIPVPVHPSRKRKRGFNQAEVLADGIGAGLGIFVYPEYLKRNKKTLPQKNLTFSERLKNLEQAFAEGCLPPSARTVMLVDDIYTTGSTAEACARVLKRAGVKRVYVLNICIGQD